MSFDMIEAMTLIAREKNIEFDAVLETLEAGLMAAAKKKYAFTDNITFRFDRKNNELLMIATKRVVEQVADPNVELTLAEAKDIDPEAELGDEVDIYIDYEVEFGRNAIAAASRSSSRRSARPNATASTTSTSTRSAPSSPASSSRSTRAMSSSTSAAGRGSCPSRSRFPVR
ncbi:MAG TPA: NusA N-terminal domain-containing protein, partial [candidate division Zixibacteria bacterium]|nr:NusA N-terminal domain-containing protein [candidate division Zixibacteria bacterium]